MVVGLLDLDFFALLSFDDPRDAERFEVLRRKDSFTGVELPDRELLRLRDELLENDRFDLLPGDNPLR